VSAQYSPRCRTSSRSWSRERTVLMEPRLTPAPSAISPCLNALSRCADRKESTRSAFVGSSNSSGSPDSNASMWMGMGCVSCPWCIGRVGGYVVLFESVGQPAVMADPVSLSFTAPARSASRLARSPPTVSRAHPPTAARAAVPRRAASGGTRHEAHGSLRSPLAQVEALTAFAPPAPPRSSAAGGRACGRRSATRCAGGGTGPP